MLIANVNHELLLLFVPKQQRFCDKVRMALAKITSAVSKQVAGNVTKTPASAAMSATKTAASAAMSATKAAASAATTSPQHSLYENIRQPHPSVVQMADQQPAAMMAGSYPAATYPNVFYTPQSGTVRFMQPPQPALQPQTQVSQYINFK